MTKYDDDHAPLLPAGTVLHLIGIHDNTPTNPKDPDPTQWVEWGQRSVDEVTAAHISFEFLKDEDYKQLAAERQAKQRSGKSQESQSIGRVPWGATCWMRLAPRLLFCRPSLTPPAAGAASSRDAPLRAGLPDE